MNDLQMLTGGGGNSLLLRRRMMMGSHDVRYKVFGNPIISGSNMTVDENNTGFIYTNALFDPSEASSWSIQVRLKVNTFNRWASLINSVSIDGVSGYSICVSIDINSGEQTVGFMASNSNYWNIMQFYPRLSLSPAKDKFNTLKLEYEKDESGTMRVRMGWTESGQYSQWFNLKSSPTWGKCISFGNVYADYDLSETKIIIDGKLWWQAL